MSDSAFIKSVSGKIVASSPVNVDEALRRLAVRFRYDELSRSKMFGMPGKPWEYLSDHDVDSLWLLIERHFGFCPLITNVRNRIDALCQASRYDPVREYLHGLAPWDGEPRLDNWLSRYVGAVETRDSRLVGRAVLVAAARRIERPGTRYGRLVVLRHDIKAPRSRIWDTLVPDENWLGSEINNPDGHWFLEIGDLTYRERAIERFVTSIGCPVKIPYSRDVDPCPHRVVAVATIYGDQSQGFRDYCRIVDVGAPDLGSLGRDRDQLWAEALIAARGTESVEPETEAQETTRGAASLQPLQPDPLVARLSDWVAAAESRGETCYKLVEIADALGIPPEHVLGETKRLTQIVKVTGLRQKTMFRGADRQRQRYWTRKHRIEFSKPLADPTTR